MRRVLVIGATGTVGGEVVRQLASEGVRVRAMARNPLVARLPANVEVVRGDLAAPETLDDALDGAHAVFLVWTAPAATAGAAFERIAKRAQRIVYLSAPLKTPHPLFQQPNRGRDLAVHIESLIQTSGLEWTLLRPGMFAANALGWWAPQIRAGDLLRWPFLDVPTAPIHERDIAAVAVRALCDEGRAGAEYVMTGPEALTHREQISTIGRVIGRELRVEEIVAEDARRELGSILSVPVANMLIDAWAAAAGHPALVTSTVAAVVGGPAHTFADWVADHAAEFGSRAASL
jgi:uncharacterized protein YbjT (DUF2867 family)